MREICRKATAAKSALADASPNSLFGMGASSSTASVIRHPARNPKAGEIGQWEIQDGLMPHAWGS